ncbi:MAG TPA: Maf family protein [Hyphomicrobiaceae bacterium]|jgi:septum formation protein|nr:Maf family protein [Hyphomicrobiaceae bacterium]
MAEAENGGLLLASASPFRRRLLEAAGVAFRVAPAHVDEAAIKRNLVPGVGPAAVADAVAGAKAEAVSARFPADLVVGADQVLALGETLLSKPGDLARARAQLKQLRGKTHRQFAAVVLAQGGQVMWRAGDSATLTMRDFSDAFLEAYLARCGAILGQIVGAYEIEGVGIQLFECVEGDYFTIIGLPLVPLLAELRARGVIQT